MGVNDHAWSAQTYLQRWGALQDGENWGQEPHAVRTPARTEGDLAVKYLARSHSEASQKGRKQSH